MSTSVVYKQYLRALNQWPVDLLRPEVSFQKAMRRRIDRRFLPSQNRPQGNVIANGAQVTVPTAVELDEKAELDQVNVLYSFLENRYGNKFPLSKTFMEPASNPTYYKDLMNELHEAPRRSWFGSMVKRWKGFLRFS